MYLPRRLHLFEFEDKSWFPDALRVPLLDYLSYLVQRFDIYGTILGHLAAVVARSESRAVVGLCCGGAGDFASVLERVLAAPQRPSRVTLTDLYPNLAAFGALEAKYPSLVRAHASPVDATAVPDDLAGARVIFTAFHHFRPDTARLILRDAVATGEPIAVFEFSDRSLRSIISTAISAIPFMLFHTPFMRPARARQWWWTYTGVLPLVMSWDGTVSQLRSYTPAELGTLAREADPHGKYTWASGTTRHPRMPLTITHLTGWPDPG